MESIILLVTFIVAIFLGAPKLLNRQMNVGQINQTQEHKKYKWVKDLTLNSTSESDGNTSEGIIETAGTWIFTVKAENMLENTGDTDIRNEEILLSLYSDGKLIGEYIMHNGQPITVALSGKTNYLLSSLVVKSIKLTLSIEQLQG